MNHSKSNLITLLRSAGASGMIENTKGAIMRCPFHNDKRPSANVFCKDGIWKFRCFVCDFTGDYYDVEDKAQGWAKGESYKRHNAKESVVKQERIYSLKEIESEGIVYRYTNPESNKIDLIVLRVERDGKKHFRLFTPNSEGFVAKGLERLPLYNRSRVLKAPVVVICEGEKCVHALHKADIVATTKPCGANSPEKADWSPVYGKEVILWPDNDEVGIRYMQQVKELLLPHCKVKWIEPGELDLPPKGDAVEFLEKINYDPQAARIPLLDAKSCGASQGVKQYLDDVISGKLTEVNWPWTQLTNLTASLTPGSTTLFVGAGGAGKSLFITESAVKWKEQGIKWLMYALESSKEAHLLRALAMRVKDSSLTRMKTIKSNSGTVTEYYNQNKAWIDDFGSRIIVPPMDIGQLELSKWLEKHARDNRILIIDPVSIANKDMQPKISPWDSDRLFIKRMEEVAKASGVSVVCVTHPKADKLCLPSQHNIDGSQAWPRFMHNCFWLESVPETEAKCLMPGFTHSAEDVVINKKLHLLKCRNGEASTGTKLGYWFDSATLSFTEKGIVVKDKK